MTAEERVVDDLIGIAQAEKAECEHRLAELASIIAYLSKHIKLTARKEK